MKYLLLISRDTEFFKCDLNNRNDKLNDLVEDSRFLVIGGAGSIGRSVCRERGILNVIQKSFTLLMFQKIIWLNLCVISAAWWTMEVMSLTLLLSIVEVLVFSNMR